MPERWRRTGDTVATVLMWRREIYKAPGRWQDRADRGKKCQRFFSSPSRWCPVPGNGPRSFIHRPITRPPIAVVTARVDTYGDAVSNTWRRRGTAEGTLLPTWRRAHYHCGTPTSARTWGQEENASIRGCYVLLRWCVVFSFFCSFMCGCRLWVDGFLLEPRQSRGSITFFR